MAGTLRDIRKRIIAVKKTQKITRAMKMVSAAKFARAGRAIQSARPYAEKLSEVLGSVASGVDPDAHPLIQPRTPVRKLDVVVFTSDRGLCGAYNTNITRFAERLIVQRRPELERVSLICVGRKSADAARRRRLGEITRQWPSGGTVLSALAGEVARFLAGRYERGECDEVVLVYSQFLSAISQRPVSQGLLPLRPERPSARLAGYEIEPDAEGLLAELIPRAVEFAIFRALLENQAGEHGARMTAMENATSNTQELIRSLTLEFNKARQAAITAELVEIVSGAQAL
jgi:F-type H+-transporting ATPase subunit gamma